MQLWTTGNWHWYLKFELRPLGSTRFLSIAWHPEQAQTLLLTSECKQDIVITPQISTAKLASLFEYNFEYDTITSLGGPPNDLGMVAVTDKGMHFTIFLVRTHSP